MNCALANCATFVMSISDEIGKESGDSRKPEVQQNVERRSYSFSLYYLLGKPLGTLSLHLYGPFGNHGFPFLLFFYIGTIFQENFQFYKKIII